MVCPAEERARIIDDGLDPGIVIWLLGMVRLSDLLDGGVDFNGVYMPGSGADGSRNIVACAGADHGNIRQFRLDLIGQIIVCTRGCQLRSELLRREIENTLIVVTRGKNKCETGLRGIADL